METAYAMMGAAAKDPRLQNVFTQFRINSPQIESNIDRNKAKSIGVSLNDVFTTMEVDLGSLYVNNFTYLNRSWQVDVQADAPFRNSVASLRQLCTCTPARHRALGRAERDRRRRRPVSRRARPRRPER